MLREAVFAGFFLILSLIAIAIVGIIEAVDKWKRKRRMKRAEKYNEQM